MIKPKNLVQEKDVFCEMLGRLQYRELELVLDSLYRYGADQLFVDLAQMELDSRVAG
ncbi:MAG: hypothetical protein ACOCQA_02525 [bacterium]